MIVRDLIKELLDTPPDAEVLIRVFASARDGQRTEIDIERVITFGEHTVYVAIEDGDR